MPWDVFAETLNTLGKHVGHGKALDVGQYLGTTDPFLVIDASTEAKQAALARFGTQPPSVSFTDCLVMAVADEYQTTRIFGFDEAFANGYRILSKLPRAA